MIPIYTPHHHECANCEAHILIGYEFIVTDNAYFCSEDCAKCYYFLEANGRNAYLTNDKIYRGDY